MVGAGGKSVYVFVVGALLLRVPGAFFFLLLRVPGAFCFFLLRVRGAFFSAGARQVQSLTCCPPPPSIRCRETSRVRDAFFLLRVRELTHSLAARRPEHPQQQSTHSKKKHGFPSSWLGQDKKCTFLFLIGFKYPSKYKYVPNYEKGWKVWVAGASLSRRASFSALLKDDQILGCSKRHNVGAVIIRIGFPFTRVYKGYDKGYYRDFV